MAERKAHEVAGDLMIHGVPQEAAQGSVIVIIGIIIQIVNMIYQCAGGATVAAAERAANPGWWDTVRLRWILWRELKKAGIQQAHWFTYYVAILDAGKNAMPWEIETIYHESQRGEGG